MECVNYVSIVGVLIAALFIRRIRIAKRYSQNRTMRALSVASMLKRVQRNL
jgi:hypothetical protein